MNNKKIIKREFSKFKWLTYTRIRIENVKMSKSEMKPTKKARTKKANFHMFVYSSAVPFMPGLLFKY